MQDSINEGNEELPVSTESMDDSVIRSYKAILLSPRPVVSLSCILSKSKLRAVKINNETGASARKLSLESIKNKGSGCVAHFKRRNNTMTFHCFEGFVSSKATNS